MSPTRKLFSRLDFSHPGLAAARARLNAGDEPAALRAIIEHFRTRTRPTYLFGEADVAAFHDAITLAVRSAGRSWAVTFGEEAVQWTAG